MNIVLCYPVEPQQIQQIQRAAPDARIINAGQEGIADAIHQADLFCGHAKVPVDWDQVVEQGRLQWIQSSAAGLDHCLVPSVIQSRIEVSSASGLFADQVAEQTLSLLLGLIRSLPEFFRAMRRREFVRRPTDDLHGKTVGIVGFGGNGRRIAEVLAPFRCQLLATDWFPENQPEFVSQLVAADQLDAILPECDVVILALPLNAATLNLFDPTRFARMKPGSYLINVARGPIVHESALLSALASGHLKGAGLDVTEIEPLPDSSGLWNQANVLITPHVGAQSAQRVQRTTDFFCDNLKRYLAGQRLKNRVDKQLGFPQPCDAAWANPDT